MKCNAITTSTMTIEGVIYHTKTTVFAFPVALGELHHKTTKQFSTKSRDLRYLHLPEV